MTTADETSLLRGCDGEAGLGHLASDASRWMPGVELVVDGAPSEVAGAASAYPGEESP